MSDRQKKSRERFWVERFRDESSLDFSIEDNRKLQERPDFLIRFAGKLIGLEVAEVQVDHDAGITEGSPLQAELALQQSVLRRAQKRYLSIGGASLNAKVCFRGGPGQSLQNFNRTAIADDLSDLLASLNVAPTEQLQIDGSSVRAPCAPIAFVYVRGLPNSVTPRWQVVQSGWAKPFEQSDVESLIETKNMLYPKYCETIPINWLLLVADGSKPAGMFIAPAQTQMNLPRSVFDQTYLLCDPSRFLIKWSATGKNSRIKHGVG